MIRKYQPDPGKDYESGYLYPIVGSIVKTKVQRFIEISDALGLAI